MVEAKSGSSRGVPSLFPTIALLFLVPPATAADWRVSKGIETGVVHVDDAGPSDEGSDSESVLSLSPYIRLDASGRRSELSLDGRVELERQIEEERTEIEPVLALDTRSVLVDGFATLKTNARVTQRPIETASVLDDGVAEIEDRTAELYEIGIVPSIGDDIGTRTRYDASYSFAATRSSDDALVGSDSHGLSLNAGSLLGGKVLLLGSGDYRRSRFENEITSTAELFGLGLGYRFTPRTLLGFVAVGHERVRPGGSLDTIEDTFWRVGARWRPNARFEANVGYGEGAYGRKPSVSLALTGRRSTLSLDWSRELGLAGPGVDFSLPATVGESGAGAVDEVPAETELPTADPGGEIFVGDALSPLARDALSIDEQVALGYELRGRRSTFSADLGWGRRERLDTDLVVDERELGLGFGRALSPRAQATARWTVTETDASDEPGSRRVNRVELSFLIAL